MVLRTLVVPWVVMVTALNELPHNERSALRDLYLLVSSNHSVELALLIAPTAISSIYCPVRRRLWSIYLHLGFCNTGWIRHETYTQPSTLFVFLFSLMPFDSPTHSPFPTGHWISLFRSI